MTPLEILQDLITIARMIHQQAQLAQINPKNLQALSDTVNRVVSSLEGLSILPNNKQFIEGLEALQRCLKETNTFIQSQSRVGPVEGFLYAKRHAAKINEFKMQILELVPLLNIGLSAQQLIDRDKDRKNEADDHQDLILQQERHFRALQANQLGRGELEDIIQKQMASIEYRLAQNLRVTDRKQSILPEELMVHFYDLVFDRKIGKSELGALYSGTWRGQPVTIKWVEHLATSEERSQFIKEVTLMSTLHNEHITPCYGACFEDNRLCYLTDVMEVRELSQVLTTLNRQERLRMAQDLAYGLAYLHDRHIVHGDIRPNNIAINQHNRGKWMNVGLVQTRVSSVASMMVDTQAVCWQAPESWARHFEPTPASDVYAFGCLLWFVMTGRMLYQNKSGAEVMHRVRRGERESFPEDFPLSCKEIIEACWKREQLTRPSAREIAQRLADIVHLSPSRASSPTGEALYESGIKAQEANHLEEARAFYQRACNKNYSKAFTSMGLFKLSGLGKEPINKKEAVADLKRAVEGGHARAMFNLGRIYEKGDTEEGICDYSTALHWYNKALIATPNDARCREKVESLTKLLKPSDSTYQYASKTFV